MNFLLNSIFSGRKAFFFLFFILFFSNIQLLVTYSTTSDFEEKILFIAENNLDNELAVFLNRSINSGGELINIRPSEDLNILFLQEEYFQTYSRIIMILSHVSIPFNKTLVDQLATFIESGGIFVFISVHIWQFTDDFQKLLGFSINPGQKIWPIGNSTEEITFTIYNDTFLHYPYEFDLYTTITFAAEIGIAFPMEEKFRLMTSEQTPIGNSTMNSFQNGSGFIIAAPISPVSSISKPFIDLLTSVFTSAINLIDELNSSGSIKTNITSTNNSSIYPVIRPLFDITEEVVQVSVIVISVSALILGLAYFISKWRNINAFDQIPKDRNWVYSFFLAPIIFIGKVIYPPIIRRIDHYDVISNETRKRIIENLEDHDFLHFRELKRELDNIGNSSLKWHLQVLEDFGLIKRQIFGQYEIFYLRHSVPEYEYLELYFAMKSGLGYRIARSFNKEMNSWDLNSLEKYLGASKESIRYHCKKFEELKLLKRENGRYFLNLEKEYLLKKAIFRRQKIN